MTLKQKQQIFKSNDRVEFQIKGQSENGENVTFLFERKSYGMKSNLKIESVRKMIYDSWRLESMNVDTITPTFIKLYSYDMFNLKIKRSIRFDDIFNVKIQEKEVNLCPI